MDIIYYPYWSEPGSNLELFAHVEVSGEIVRGDAERLAEAIVKHSDVAFISLANSPGGILLEGILIAGVVYKSRLPLQVFGNIASAASIVSVSAFDTLSFSDTSDYEAQLYLHCAYRSVAHSCDSEGTNRMAQELGIFTHISPEAWYNILMSSTSPTSFVAFPIKSFFREWDC